MGTMNDMAVLTFDDGSTVIMSRAEILADKDALLGIGEYIVNAALGENSGRKQMAVDTRKGLAVTVALWRVGGRKVQNGIAAPDERVLSFSSIPRVGDRLALVGETDREHPIEYEVTKVCWYPDWDGGDDSVMDVIITADEVARR